MEQVNEKAVNVNTVQDESADNIPLVGYRIVSGIRNLEITEDLTPSKDEKVYLAYVNDTPEQLILKLVDSKREAIYGKLVNLWNPYIASVYGIISIQGQRYAVTEFAYGLPLREYIKVHGMLNRDQALDICIKLCSGLENVHAAGIIHRDLSPNNIIIDDSKDDLKLKIIDFGIAREHTKKAASDTTVMGTKGFTAPEIYSSTQSNTTADIYSIGCILNYMLTGKAPGVELYKGDSRIESIIKQTVSEAPKDRYGSVRQLKNNLISTLRNGHLGKIPLLGRIPGFRSRSIPRMFFASLFYFFALLLNAWFIYWHHKFWSIIIINIFWILIPFAIAINLGKRLDRVVPNRMKTAIFAIIGFHILLMISSWFFSTLLLFQLGEFLASGGNFTR